MNGVDRYRVRATCGLMVTGLGVAAGMPGCRAAGSVRHMRARIGAIRTTTGIRMDGTTTMATGIVTTTAITMTGIMTVIGITIAARS
jgi:hypothetical protein